jgi:hypothetical protein
MKIVRLLAFSGWMMAAIQFAMPEELECDTGKLPARLVESCKHELITSSGATHISQASAAGSAERAWMSMVRARFGEQFMEWSRSACRRTICGTEGPLKTHRCTVSAYPCRGNAN